MELGWQDLDPWWGRGRRQLRWRGRRSDRIHCRFQSIPQELCSEQPRWPPVLLSLRPDWIKLVFKDPIIFSFLPEKLEFQNKLHAPWESRQTLGSPDIGHPSVQCQPAGSGMHAVSDLDITDVQSICSFSPPCGEDHGGAIYLKFVFGVVKYLDPRLVSRESYWERDTIIQVGKWPLWSKWPGEESFLSFWNGLIEDGPSPAWGRNGPLARHLR